MSGRDLDVGGPWPERSWHLRRGAVDDAWKYSRGRGVTVAVIDHGFFPWLRDFSGSIVEGAGYLRRTSPTTAEFFESLNGMPGDFHGTFCAAIAVGRPNERLGISGVAPEAGFLPIACERDVASSQLTLAMAVACAVNASADVISCSLGPESLAMTPALEDALVFARSCGRGGLGTPVFWAVSNADVALATDAVNSSGLTIPVGRSDAHDRRRRAAHGGHLAFLAPGEHVFSVFQDGTAAPDSGTSYAAPFAAGVAALLLSLDSDMTVDELVDVMQRTCDPIAAESTQPNARVGFGRLNAHRASADVNARRQVQRGL